MREKLIALSMMKRGDWLSMYQVLKKDQFLMTIKEEVVKDQLSELNAVVVTIIDEQYPEAFKEMRMPPFVLFCQGDIRLLKGAKIGVIGNKKPTNYGISACKALLPALLQQELVVVSGLQTGIEALAHQLALTRGKSLAFLPSGFDYIYPVECRKLYRQLAKEHLVVTELPPKTKPSWRQYFRSYRLLQSLSDVLAVFELERSDLRLAHLQNSIDDGKPIFALPDHYDSLKSGGCLSLIDGGANCLTDYQKISNTIKKWI